MSIMLDDTLMERRGKLALAVHATYREELWKGSDAWRAHQAARRALDQFDLEYPAVVLGLYGRFEEYVVSAVGVGQTK
jgi:N-acyl-L-homoserine lactone synthetase